MTMGKAPVKANRARPWVSGKDPDKVEAPVIPLIRKLSVRERRLAVLPTPGGAHGMRGVSASALLEAKAVPEPSGPHFKTEALGNIQLRAGLACRAFPADDVWVTWSSSGVGSAVGASG
jgi:hypothetical protein